MSTEFLIVRHGETPWNVERRIQGWRDIDLNDNGREQATRLAERLSHPGNPHAPLHAIYSSDLSRARSTAQAVAKRLTLPLGLIEGIRERNYGVLEGVPFDQMHEHYPEVATVWQTRDPDGVIPKGETLREFHARVTQALESLAAKHQQQRVLVVTHGGAMDILWRAATGEPIETPRKVVMLNASINRIRITASQTGFEWSLIDWGDVSHLQNSDNDVVA
ncbi:MAG: histidine phosphatase family protein [Burkholderiaceae bacterium]|nr:histidine phosphatase family protein [Burkholderiaceae bacterium]MCD8517121.1 histidine phosphatase family protein [Burkholderiaceae bacterium]MCD8537704.1 histidine phosphatase family protein [Burkholderiaceae bacterium]MCD8565523.1 histidine phosphatase family protein [Burkholderiaceae bacterium]